jgi:hypothetical protein
MDGENFYSFTSFVREPSGLPTPLSFLRLPFLNESTLIPFSLLSLFALFHHLLLSIQVKSTHKEEQKQQQQHPISHSDPVSRVLEL